MNNLYLSFIIINIFAWYGYSYPASKTPVFDNIDSKFIQACPLLNNSVLLDKHSEFLSKCIDVELTNAPKSIDVVNLKNFLCIGVFEAYIRLCNALSSDTSYSYLPQTDIILKQNINEIEKFKSDVVCKEFKQIYSTSDNKSPELLPWMSVLNENLKEPICIHLCSDISQTSTNVLCSMLFYINQHIKNITTLKTVVVTTNHAVNAIKPTKTGLAHLNTELVLPTIAIVQSTPKMMQIDVEGIGDRGTLEKDRETNVGIKHKQKDTNLISKKTKATRNNGNKLNYPTVSKELQSADQQQVQSAVQQQVQSNAVQQDVHNTAVQQDVHSAAVQPDVHSAAVQPDVHSAAVQQDVHSTGVQEQIQSTSVPQELAVPSVPTPTPLLVSAVTNPKLSNDTNIADEKPAQIPETRNEVAPKVSEEANLSKVISETKLGDIFDTGAKDALDANGQQEYDDEDDDVSPIAEKNVADSVQIRPVDSSGNARHFVEVEDSNFFSYFMFISVMFIFGYVVYHNKQKILALLLEGRRDRNARRRPSTSSYRKLNSNLEEAVTSKCSGSASNVIY